MSKWPNRLLWIVYLALLGVLLPHTAWAFGQFEPDGWRWVGWVGAAAFEGAIAALTWRLKQRIELTPRYKSGWVGGRRLMYRYLNVYGGGLVLAVLVSSAANWAHAVQFGQPFMVFTAYSVPPWLYSVAFGGILPVCSLLFARILADTQDAEHEADPALAQASDTIRDLRRQLVATEQRAALAEQRYAAIGDLAIMLTAEDKRQRILAVRERWPQLPERAIAMITETSASYVNEVKSNGR